MFKTDGLLLNNKSMDKNLSNHLRYKQITDSLISLVDWRSPDVPRLVRGIQ